MVGVCTVVVGVVEVGVGDAEGTLPICCACVGVCVCARDASSATTSTATTSTAHERRSMRFVMWVIIDWQAMRSMPESLSQALS